MLKRIRQVNEIDILNEIFQQNVKDDRSLNKFSIEFLETLLIREFPLYV